MRALNAEEMKMENKVGSKMDKLFDKLFTSCVNACVKNPAKTFLTAMAVVSGFVGYLMYYQEKSFYEEFAKTAIAIQTRQYDSKKKELEEISWFDMKPLPTGSSLKDKVCTDKNCKEGETKFIDDIVAEPDGGLLVKYWSHSHSIGGYPGRGAINASWKKGEWKEDSIKVAPGNVKKYSAEIKK